MKQFLLAGVAAAGLVLGATAAQAAFVGTVPLGSNQNNQVIPPFTQVEGYYGVNLYLVGGPATIKVTLIGHEDGNQNTFTWNGVGVPGFINLTGQNGTLGSPIGTTAVFNNVASGLLPFGFTTSVNSANGNVADGANVDPNGNKGNFFVTLGNCIALSCIDGKNPVAGTNTVNGSTPSSGTVAWIFYDDLGAGPDDNHDDLVVRLEITGGTFTVPEPATLGLLGAGLLGLGALARRRRRV